MLNSALNQRISRLKTTGCIALLALILAAIVAVVSPLAFLLGRSGGVAAAALAATVVWFASSLGMTLGQMVRGPNQAMFNLLISMIVRMTIPLVACFLAYLSGSQLARDGFAFYVLVFYLLALPVDTIFAVVPPANQHLTGGA